MSDIFISYAKADRGRAEQLAKPLEAQGWSVWWDPKLRTGERFDDVIEEALTDAKCVIVLWSQLSVKSRYVKDEVSYALNRHKLVPVAFEEVNPPFRFKGLHTERLDRWDGSDSFPAFQKLVADIASILKAKEEAERLLPQDLRAPLNHPESEIVKGATIVLGRYLQGEDQELALAAKAELQRLAEDDRTLVHETAREILAKNRISLEQKPVTALPNWEGSITSYPSVVTRPRNVDDIIAILKDSENYPSPVRAVGSNHSTTRCTVADGGTVLDMTEMSRIIEVRDDTVTAEAGALYIDVAHELRKHGLQFYVNVEIGNLTIGSAACGGTKDASFPPDEFGQVSSYACAIKAVQPSGELLEVTEQDPDLLQVMRSSYGLLGIVYEATFKVKPLKPMAVVHKSYSLDKFCQQLPKLIQQQKSMMLYLFPFLNTITVEFREYRDDGRPSNRWVWRLRNWVWAKGAPTFAYYVTKLVPIKFIRYLIINMFNWVLKMFLTWVLKSANTDPADQTIRYPEKSGRSKYTFSIWAFPEENYTDVVRAYFRFCRDYYKRHGYRCNLLNVGYRINKDNNGLFSYSFNGTVMTVDPVATGDPGWVDFLDAYNEFCSERGGVPLFNQTRGIKPPQAKKAFAKQIKKFNSYRKRFDPSNRLLTPYFQELLK